MSFFSYFNPYFGMKKTIYFKNCQRKKQKNQGKMKRIIKNFLRLK